MSFGCKFSCLLLQYPSGNIETLARKLPSEVNGPVDLPLGCEGVLIGVNGPSSSCNAWVGVPGVLVFTLVFTLACPTVRSGPARTFPHAYVILWAFIT